MFSTNALSCQLDQWSPMYFRRELYTDETRQIILVLINNRCPSWRRVNVTKTKCETLFCEYLRTIFHDSSDSSGERWGWRKKTTGAICRRWGPRKSLEHFVWLDLCRATTRPWNAQSNWKIENPHIYKISANVVICGFAPCYSRTLSNGLEVGWPFIQVKIYM